MAQPDSYKTIKCSLKSIIKDDNKNTNFNKLYNACLRAHKLVIHVYQFLRLWLLDHYHKQLPIPHISEDTIKFALKALSIDETRGGKMNDCNDILYKQLKDFYDNEYKDLNYGDKISAKNLAQTFMYLATDIFTNIENNIKLHFSKYVKQFVNYS